METDKQISIKDFQLEGDLFYTESIRLYCSKAGAEYVSSFEEIDLLEMKVKELINNDDCCISSEMDRKRLIEGYFTALRVKLSALKGTNKL